MEDLFGGGALQRDKAHKAQVVAPEAQQIRLVMDMVGVAVFHNTAVACVPTLECLRGRTVVATR